MEKRPYIRWPNSQGQVGDEKKSLTWQTVAFRGATGWPPQILMDKSWVVTSCPIQNGPFQVLLCDVAIGCAELPNTGHQESTWKKGGGGKFNFFTKPPEKLALIYFNRKIQWRLVGFLLRKNVLLRKNRIAQFVFKKVGGQFRSTFFPDGFLFFFGWLKTQP